MGKGKIIVIGANQGALAFACFAGEKGFDVTVFEQKQQCDIAYEWADELVANTFEKLGIERPPKILNGPKPHTVLVSPDRQNHITIPQSSGEVDIPVDRRELDMLLYNRAIKAGVKVNFGCAVKSATISHRKVTGVILENGEALSADLVVDCGGAQSVIRSNLPDELHIPQIVNPDDMFFVRRIYFERAKGSEIPKFWRKIYLKHMNEKGISWCWLSLDEKMADVLIGRLGGLSDSSYNRAIADLKSENDIMSDTVIKGGQLCTIPVRHNISRMVASGYALVGDSAYMTIPMIGSGMANSMTAAKILCDVIEEPVGNPFYVENLYRYQYKYMKEIGAPLACVELLKNHFLSENDYDLNYILSSGIVSDSLLQGTSGEIDGVPAKEIFNSIIAGLKNPSVMGRLIKLVAKMGLLYETASHLPKEYNDYELLSWQEKYDSFFN